MMTTQQKTVHDAARLCDKMDEGFSYRQAWREIGLDRLEAWNAKRFLKREGRWPVSPLSHARDCWSPGDEVEVDRSHIHRACQEAAEAPLDIFRKWSVPPSTMKRFDAHERLTGDVAFLSDLHCPFHSAQVIEGCMETSDRMGVKHLVLGGDQMDNGAWHKSRGGFRQSLRWQDAAEQYEGVLKALIQCYERITILSGNHCDWYTAHFKGEVDGSWMMSRIVRNEDDRIRFSDYEIASLTSGGKEWTLLHGANYSATNPLGVVQKYAAKYGTNMVVGHQHVSAEGFDVSSRFQCIANGGGHDPALFGYTHVAPRTNPKQVQGYTIIKDGVGRLYKYVDNRPV